MATMTNRDYYEVLGVSKTAQPDEIKRAFKKKAAQLHPDNKDSGDEAEFKVLVAAYEVLSDEQKRATYDRYGAEGLKNSGGGGGGGGFEGNFDPNAFGDLSDIFEYFFGGGARTQSRQRNQPQRGSDLRHDMEMDFLEAVFGVEKKVTIKHLEECTVCNGNGAAPGIKPVTCKDCNGQGHRKQTTATLFGQFITTVACPTCSGEGTIIEKPCGECKGKGQLRKSKTIELKIPAGVDNGARLRVGGGGDQGKRGAPPGDLYVILHVRPHAVFQRDSVHVHMEQAVSFSMAALGGDLAIETVSGPKVMKIPAGTQGGTVMVMREQGIPHLGNPTKRGDQMVHIAVETPSKLTEEEKQLLRKLAELRGESLTVARSEANSKDAQPSLFDTIAGVFKSKTATDE